MSDYAAPLADMRFALNEIVNLRDVAALPGCEQAAPDLVDQVLEAAAKLAGDVIAPLNVVGDRERSRLENGVVRTPTGFSDAYRSYVEGGWNALPFDPEFGGQGLPQVVSTAVLEMWTSANLSFSLCPMLTIGAVELLQAHGSLEQKRLYLAKMISGEWTGTMNLTEPQAGSDVGALRTRAVKKGDHYEITGQKIFITYGDHDMAANIVHMVLARLPDAPAGTRGISLFIVPKRLVNPDGTLGENNDLRPVSLEHKLGIHGSPTCVMAYGDRGGATGYLVGEPNRGMELMFTMMNNARLNVGLQGVAIAERAYQQARDFARVRVQGKPVGVKADGPLPIIHHPDVRRMLLDMRASTEAARALTYYVAAGIDRARHHPNAEERARQQRRVDLLIPVVKAWCTDIGVEVASTGVQIHGGMGYIEETGAAQHLRDARIAPIYEGTNGIQAADLVGRKIARDAAAAVKELIAEMRTLDAEHLSAGVDALSRATDWMAAALASDMPRALAGSVPYLRMLGTVVSGWLLAKGARAAEQAAKHDGKTALLQAKVNVARFFAEHRLATAPAMLPAITAAATTVGFDPEQL
ncbi:MAG TPA: acyl-CoA dehydrogenase [Stellaceae bacterium]|nr:acyl-CoA dehydrogenase [Stellaceae bacterium]